MAANLSKLRYVKDAAGDDLLVSPEGWQVMMQWEKPYMEACVDILHLGPNSDVLEIGFGLGYSSNRIQTKGVRSHTIIECCPKVLERLRKWKNGEARQEPEPENQTTTVSSESQAEIDSSPSKPKKPRRENPSSSKSSAGAPKQNVTIVEGLWQLQLPKLGKFDAVFMDDYPVGVETFKAQMIQQFPQQVEFAAVH